MSGLNQNSLWLRVQEHLDARRDPLDDPDVKQFLLDNPQHLEEFAELRHGLRALEPVIGPRRHRKVPWAAAVMLLCALGLLWVLEAGNGELPAPDIARGGRVLLFDIETVTHLRSDANLEITRTRRYAE